MFLSADCVFKNLTENNVLECTDSEWKITSRTQEAPYYRSFFIHKKTLRCIKSFQIIIQDGKHLVLSKSVEVLLSGCNDNDKAYIKDVIKKCAA